MRGLAYHATMSNKIEFKESRQLAIRLPKWMYNRAVALGPKPSVAIVAALTELWGPAPETAPSNKQTDKAA